jgi:hypothetical protein
MERVLSNAHHIKSEGYRSCEILSLEVDGGVSDNGWHRVICIPTKPRINLQGSPSLQNAMTGLNLENGQAFLSHPAGPRSKGRKLLSCPPLLGPFLPYDENVVKPPQRVQTESHCGSSMTGREDGWKS